MGLKWAAAGLPFLLSAGAAGAQTTGLVAPMSGDCTTTATGVVTCVAKGGSTLSGPAGTVATFNAAGAQAAPVAAPYTGNAGPVKVAPFNVSAPTAAGTLVGPYGTTSFRAASITNGARLMTSGAVSQVKAYIASTTGATGLYFELWRVNASGTFGLVCRSQNMLSAVTQNALNTLAVTSTCNGQAGDYPAMFVTGNWTGQATIFSASTAYPAASYPSYYANGAQMSSTEDFFGGTNGATYTAYSNMAIEVYLAKGPVLVGMGDSKMQGIPFSGDYTQAAYNGMFQFPIAPQTNYSTATLGTSLIDLSNQPIAWAARTLGYSYANLGMAGSTSTAQLAQQLPTALALKPAVLVISGTINDSAYQVPTNTSVSNYTSMYNQAIAAGVQKVVMTGVEPAGSIAETLWSNTSYGGDALNAGLKSFCQAQTACVWIGDAVMAGLGQYRTGGAAGSLHNIQPAFAAADNLHFNNAGSQAMGVLEANAIEAPTAAGNAVAVTNPFGTATRSRVTMAVTHDGSLGWRWQDTRDFLQMDQQGLDGTPGSPVTGTPGQQTVGCVTFTAGKGYVRCDGTFVWSQQASTLTLPTLSATTATANALFAKGAFSSPAAGNGALYLFGDVVNGGGIETGNWGTAALPMSINTRYSGGLKVGGYVAVPHLIGSSAVPAVAAGAAAASCTLSGTDMGFLLTCTTGSAPAAGTLATVTFAGAYGAAPHFASPGAVNAASAAAMGGLYATSSTTALTVSTGSALTASTSYAWHFVLVQ